VQVASAAGADDEAYSGGGDDESDLELVEMRIPKLHAKVMDAVRTIHELEPIVYPIAPHTMPSARPPEGQLSADGSPNLNSLCPDWDLPPSGLGCQRKRTAQRLM